MRAVWRTVITTELRTGVLLYESIRQERRLGVCWLSAASSTVYKEVERLLIISFVSLLARRPRP